MVKRKPEPDVTNAVLCSRLLSQRLEELASALSRIDEAQWRCRNLLRQAFDSQASLVRYLRGKEATDGR